MRGPGGLDGVGAIEAVREGRATVESISRDSRARIGEWEPRLGAIVEMLEISSERHDGPLNGLILGVKDHIHVRGAVSWSARIVDPLEPARAERHSTAVQSLLDKGATIIATTSSPPATAPGAITPGTLNPRSDGLVSGGTSGGSAAAVAAGIVHGALGTDSGGSVRIPSTCCGVVGLHTTRGAVSLVGAGALTYTMDAVGPIAASVADARLIFNAIAHPDDADPYSVDPPARPRKEMSPGFRVGVPLQMMETRIDSEVRQAFQRVLELLCDLGVIVEDVSIPLISESLELGPRTIGLVEAAAVRQDLFESALVDVSDDVRSLVERSAVVPATEVVRARHRVANLRAHLRQVFTEFDVLVSPTMPCRVPEAVAVDSELEIEVGGAPESRTEALTRFVNPWNLAAVPAGTIPVGRDGRRGPIGVQVIGPPFAEGMVLDVMESVEHHLGGPWKTSVPSPSAQWT